MEGRVESWVGLGGKGYTNIRISAKPGIEPVTLWSEGRDLTNYTNHARPKSWNNCKWNPALCGRKTKILQTVPTMLQLLLRAERATLIFLLLRALCVLCHENSRFCISCVCHSVRISGASSQYDQRYLSSMYMTCCMHTVHVRLDTNLGFWERCVLNAMKNLDFKNRKFVL